MSKEYEFTDKCCKCDKKMLGRDAKYSRYLFIRVYCAAHIPDNDIYGSQTISLKKALSPTP